MALREHIGSTDPAVRYGRHSRPRPVGGRLRLPTIKFSGAAMAMSTVVGISIATTWLLNEQQGVGRRPGMSNVGASPPLPSPDSPPASTAAAPVVAARSGSPAPGTPTAPHGGPAARTTGSGRVGTTPRPGTSHAPAPASGHDPSRTPAPPTTGGPQPLRPPTTGRPADDDALSGRARVESLGTSGVRHTVVLSVHRRLTALQVELRLERPRALPGTTPTTSLPGAVTTVSVERGTLVYRYTLAAGLDLAPGRYTFEVLGARPDRADGRPAETVETWSAAAFALDDPQAVAARGTFG